VSTYNIIGKGRKLAIDQKIINNGSVRSMNGHVKGAKHARKTLGTFQFVTKRVMEKQGALF
jgi:hypothetical protein